MWPAATARRWNPAWNSWETGTPAATSTSIAAQAEFLNAKKGYANGANTRFDLWRWNLAARKSTKNYKIKALCNAIFLLNKNLLLFSNWEHQEKKYELKVKKRWKGWTHIRYSSGGAAAEAQSRQNKNKLWSETCGMDINVHWQKLKKQKETLRVKRCTGDNIS